MTSTPSHTEPTPTVPAGWRGAWNPRRARLWLFAAGVTAWLPLLAMPMRDWLDFSAFWAAGRLAFTPGVTGLAAVTALQVEGGLPITPFVYPAGMALLYAPLTWLPYGLAAALHVALMTALLVAAAAVWARLEGLPARWFVFGALAWAPAAAGVVSGQNTSLALLLVVLTAWALVRGHDGGAGVATGLLAYKPQLAAPLLGLLLLRGRWRALVASGGIFVLHWLAGVIATGGQLDWPMAWLETVGAYQEADFLANGRQAISLPAFGRQLGILTGLPGLMAAGFVIGGIIVLACLPALRRLPVAEAVALAAACGLLISPHAWVYDATLLLPALAVLAARAVRRGWPWRDRWWIAVAYAIALTWPLTAVLGFTLMPIVVLAAPFALLEVGPFRWRA